ncbi:unnamed protein product [Durusdinium trenchii]|uniref:Uncharacterized protein n=1 Tax=Durusdinium trenchii TaxID=1381693 RepID=A0ABP0KCG9_9DINO
MAETTEKTKKLEKTKVLKPLEEVIDLGTEEVPLHSAQERLELRRSDRGKGGKSKGKGKGRGRGKGGAKGAKGPELVRDRGLQERINKYTRPGASWEELKPQSDKKLRGQLKQLQRADRDAAFLLAKAEVLQTAEPGFIEQEEDNAILLTQQEIIDSAGVGVARKHFDFELPYGPYN